MPTPYATPRPGLGIQGRVTYRGAPAAGVLLVLVLDGHRDQFRRIGEAAGQAVDGLDDGFELGALLAEPLGTLGVAPDLGLFELAADFGQAVLLFSIVKDTPSRTRYVL